MKYFSKYISISSQQVTNCPKKVLMCLNNFGTILNKLQTVIKEFKILFKYVSNIPKQAINCLKLV